MTPEERANKVRYVLDLHREDEYTALIPHGAIILSPGEILALKAPLKLHPVTWRGSWLRMRDQALSLLGSSESTNHQDKGVTNG